MSPEKHDGPALSSTTPTHSVQIDEPTVARLRPYRFDLAESDIPAFATPLLDVIAAVPGREWLEAALLAGYLPHLESLDPVIRGIHAFTVARVRECEERELLGDAIGWAHAPYGYRQLIVLLEGVAIELERKRASIHRTAAHALNAEEERINITDAAAADVRVIHGRARLDLLNLDLLPPSPRLPDSD
jgi:hypothetical protein